MLLSCQHEATHSPRRALGGCCKISRWKRYVLQQLRFPPYNLEEIGLILDACKQWTHNKTRLQSAYTTVCGQYCIFYLLHAARGYSLNQITHLLDEGDTRANDAFIHTYIAEKYPYDEVKKLKAVDFPFILKQYSTANNV